MGLKKAGSNVGYVKKLCQDYNNKNNNHNETGRGRTNWKFYDMLNELLGIMQGRNLSTWSSTQQMTHSWYIGKRNDEKS